MTDQKDPQTDHGIPAYIITLIHGTYAREAGWTHKGSVFRRRLEEKLNTPLNFRRFEWSGGNSHTHRLHAGEELSEYLRTEFEGAPQSRHVVIAHSHGGNVALYALQDDELRARIDGLVCLATPFVEVRPRHLRRRLLVVAGIYVAAAILGTAGGFIVYGSRLLSGLPGLFLGLFWTGSLPFLPPMFLLLWSLLKERDEHLGLWKFLKTRRGRSELVESLRLPVLDTRKLLIVRPSGDEASGVLAASQFLTWILRRIWNFWDFAYSRVDRAFTATYLFVSLGLLIWFLAFTLLPWDKLDYLFTNHLQWVLWLATIFKTHFPKLLMAWLIAFTAFVLLPFGWFACFILGLIWSSHYAFGFDAMLLSFESETTAEASPPGEARVFQVSTPEPHLPNATLAHSRIYENEDVVNAIADWIKSQGHGS